MTKLKRKFNRAHERLRELVTFDRANRRLKQAEAAGARTFITYESQKCVLGCFEVDVLSAPERPRLLRIGSVLLLGICDFIAPPKRDTQALVSPLGGTDHNSLCSKQ